MITYELLLIYESTLTEKSPSVLLLDSTTQWYAVTQILPRRQVISLHY
ncbi:hypothetical protein VIDI103191_00345 [Vibrio diazotrophicus]|jgi:hypothetical protein